LPRPERFQKRSNSHQWLVQIAFTLAVLLLTVKPLGV